MSAPWPVDPLRLATQLSLDKPLYQPGETVFYRSLSLSRFGLAVDREIPIHFEILDPGGTVVPNSQNEGVTDRGVGNGAFHNPRQSSRRPIYPACPQSGRIFPRGKT